MYYEAATINLALKNLPLEGKTKYFSKTMSTLGTMFKIFKI